jgi:hypothetical protein
MREHHGRRAFWNDSASLRQIRIERPVARHLGSGCRFGGRCVADDFVKNEMVVTAPPQRRTGVHLDTTLTGDRCYLG